MKRHYFIGQFNWGTEEIKCLDTEIIHQIKDVLKLGKGEEVVMCDGQGKAAITQILEITKKEIVFILKKYLPKEQKGNNVVLFAAVLKKDNFEWLLQKAVEVGVDEVVPIYSTRTVKAGINEKRWLKIIKEAAEQSQRMVLPKLLPSQNLKDSLKSPKGPVLFFDPSGENCDGMSKINGSVSVFVGPEGGWDQTELDLAKQSKAKVLNLGQSILRGETAAVVATYLAKNVF